MARHKVFINMCIQIFYCSGILLIDIYPHILSHNMVFFYFSLLGSPFRAKSFIPGTHTCRIILDRGYFIYGIIYAVSKRFTIQIIINSLKML